MIFGAGRSCPAGGDGPPGVSTAPPGTGGAGAAATSTVTVAGSDSRPPLPFPTRYVKVSVPAKPAADV